MSSNTLQPKAPNFIEEQPDTGIIAGNCKIVQMSLQNFLNPLAGFWQWIMPPFSQLAFDRVQRCAHALLDGLTPNHKRAVFPGLGTEMRKAQKVESFRLSFAQPLPVANCMPSKTDQLCFVGVQSQTKRLQTFLHALQKAFCLLLVFKTEHRIIRITDNNHVTLFYLPSYSPELNPEERLNADLKQAIGRKVPVRTKAKLRAAANEHMVQLAQSPERIKSFCQDNPVKYAA